MERYVKSHRGPAAGAKLEGRIVIGSEEKPVQMSKPAAGSAPEPKRARTAPKPAASPQA